MVELVGAPLSTGTVFYWGCLRPPARWTGVHARFQPEVRGPSNPLHKRKNSPRSGQFPRLGRGAQTASAPTRRKACGLRPPTPMEKFSEVLSATAPVVVPSVSQDAQQPGFTRWSADGVQLPTDAPWGAHSGGLGVLTTSTLGLSRTSMVHRVPSPVSIAAPILLPCDGYQLPEATQAATQRAADEC